MCALLAPGGLVISSDVSVVAPHQVVTFSLSQASVSVMSVRSISLYVIDCEVLAKLSKISIFKFGEY